MSILGRSRKSSTAHRSTGGGLALRLVGIALLTLLSVAEPASAQVVPPNPPPSFPPHVGGEWGPVLDWPHVPVSMANLPDGRILTFASNERNRFPGSVNDEFTYAAIWNYLTGEIVEVPHPSHDMFCAALVTLEDGRTLVMGGRNQGLSPWVSYYDFNTEQWVQLAASDQMNNGRWYPTAVYLGNGGVFVAGGIGGGVNPELYVPGSGWTLLPGIDLSDTVLKDGLRDGSGLWPLLQLDTDGTVIHHGAVSGEFGMNNIDPFGGGGLGSITKREHSYPTFPDEGVSVLYDAGKILVAGGSISTGSSIAVANAWTIDITAPAPAAVPVSSMNWPRQFQNEVLLPTGDVLVVGGNTSGQKFTDNFAVLNAEAWDPDTDTWTVYNAQDQARTYHSTALLVADGTVISAGGGLAGDPCPPPPLDPPGECEDDHWNAEVFSPPYLFDAGGGLATRPVIHDSPSVLRLGRTFTVHASPGLSDFSMIRMSSTTHTMNTDQRFLRPSMVESSPGTYEVTLDSNENVLVPGFWMLFAMDGDVPSVAKIIQVTNDGMPRGKAITSLGHNVGETVLVQVEAADPDGNALTFSETNLPPGLTIDSETGIIAGTTTAAGVYPVTITAFDGTEAAGINFSWIVSTDRSEFGSVIVSQTDASEWHTVSLDGAVENPVVVMGPPSSNDADPTTIRVRNVTPSSFEFQIDEWDYLDGSHGSETISYLVVEAGEYVLPGGGTLVAGVANGIDFQNPWTQPFGQGVFLSTPLVLAQIVGENSGNAAYPRIHDVSTNDFTVRIQRQQLGGQVFPDEDVHWIALEPGNITNLLDADITGNVVDEVPESISLAESFSGLPHLFALMQTRNDGDSAALRVDNTSINGFDVWIEEEQSSDAETNHGNEVVGWLAIDPSNSSLGLQALFNSPPAVADPGDQSSLTGDPVSLFIQAIDPDGDDLDFSATGLPDGLSIDSITGEIFGTPTTQDVYTVTVTATDPSSALGEASFLWSISNGFELLEFPTPPDLVGASVDYTAVASPAGSYEYVWDFGDGSPAEGPFTTPDVSHTFGASGRYLVTLSVTDTATSELRVLQFAQHVALPPTPTQPTASSSIVYDAANDHVWAVNPDNDSVVVIDAVTNASIQSIPVCQRPSTLAIGGDGRVWVACQGDGVIDVIDPTTFLVEAASRIDLGAGTSPYGIVFDPSGSSAYVSLEAIGEIRRFDGATGAQLASQFVGQHIRHLAVTADGLTLHATFFVTPLLPGEESGAPVAGPSDGATVLSLDAATLALGAGTTLQVSTIPDTEVTGRGVPNYVGAPAISPDGTEMRVPSKQDNVFRGLFRDGQFLTHDSMVRAVTSRVDMSSGLEDLGARRDHDDSSIASATVYGALGTYVFTALEGNNAVAVMEPYSHFELGRADVGRAPHGMAVSPDGLTLYVDNFMDRTVSILDLTTLLDFDDPDLPVIATVSKLTVDVLPADVLLGKKLFYDATDPRLALEGYIACAACHSDGGSDGRVWDFTDLGEGLRNTISLNGRGQGHGPVHWTANFDEVQDFEGQIRHFGGAGLMSDSDFAATADPLGSSKAGLSTDLDALAAYVRSLDDVGSSPNRDSLGNLTPAGQAGQSVYEAEDCGSCHIGPAFTDSVLELTHDVGTLKGSSGPQTSLDTPTLRGLWFTGPYLHDGSAATLADAIMAHNGVSLSAQELLDLVSYLEQIDGSEAVSPSSNLLLEDFDDGDFAGWSIVDEGTVAAPSNWQVIAGVMTETSNIFSQPVDGASIPKPGSYALYDAGTGWGDYRARLDIRSTDDDAVGFMFRVQSSDDYYRFSWDQQRNYQRLVKNVGGVFTLLAENSTPYVTGTQYQLEVVVEGPSIQVLIDGVLVLSATDGDLTSGSIALYTWGNQNSGFDRVLIDPVAEEPPLITSGAGTTATVDAPYQYDANLTVEASGSSPISFSLVSGPAGFNVAPNGLVTWTPTAGQEGLHSVEIEAQNGFGSDFQSFDINVGAALIPLLTEDFSDGDFAGWSTVDEGAEFSPSDWQVIAGVMTETSNIFSHPADPGSLPKLGSYALYDIGTGWTDYRARVNIRSTDNDAIGLMFRVQSSNDYYRFSWDQQRNYQRLVKSVGGVFTLLAENSTPYVTGTQYQLEVVADGPSIQVLIDGVLVLSATDGDLTSGSIALYTWGNQNSEFSNIRVDPLAGGPPVITSVAATTATVGVAYAYDADQTLEASSSSPVSFSLVSGPAGFDVAPGGLVTWTPTAGQTGVHPIEVRADNAAGFGTQSFSVTVATPVPPLIISTPATTATVGVAYFYDANSMVEASGSNPISFSLVSGPAGFNVAPDGLVTWTPTAGQEGPHTVEIEAENSFGTDLQTFGVNVAAAPVVFLSEDFDDGDFAGWSIVDEGAEFSPSNWQVIAGVMTETSNIFSQPADAGSIPKPGSYALYDAGTGWTDYRTLLNIRSTDDDAIGLMFRVQSSNDYYRFSWDQQRNYQRLVKNVGGVFTLLAENSTPYVTGTQYQLEVVVDGSSIQVLIDGVLVLAATDGDLTSGSIALYTWGNQNSTFDDVLVEPVADTPPLITSVAATTAAVDVPYQYDANLTVEASGSSPISFSLVSGPAGFNVAPNGLVTWTPTAGQQGPQAVEIEAQNAFGSDFQSFDVDVVVALLADDFDDGDFAGWSIVDEGAEFSPSNWQVIAGVMTETSNIFSQPVDGASIPKPGSYALYDAGTGWTDYRTLLNIRSTDDDAIGLMFRVQSSNDYYRFSWDQQRNYQRLVKNVGGVFTLLAENSTPYVTGTQYQLEVVVDGSSIQVLIDGVLVLAATDGDLTSGSIALYTWGNQNSTFDDVQVNPN